jgi:hypothetical protein
MDTQQQIYNMMALADEQQKAVKDALDKLTAEREALAKERAAIAKAASEAVRQSLIGASKTLEDASKPIIDQLSGMVRAASEAEGKLSGAVAAFGWRWAVLAGSAAAGAIVVVLVAAWLLTWWQRYQVSSLGEQKAQLQAEVTQLQANADAWSKRGGRAKLERCGDKSRLCVRVDKRGAYGDEGDYYVLRGY